MNESGNFWWKVGYIVAIAVLVIPLHLLSAGDEGFAGREVGQIPR